MIADDDKTLKILEMAQDISSCDCPNIKVPFYQRLRVKLVLFISLAVLITEILVFIPAIANMQDRWLDNKHQAAQALSLVFVNEDNNVLDTLAGKDILRSTLFSAIRITRADGTEIDLGRSEAVDVSRMIHLQDYGEFESLWDALKTLLLRDKAGAIELTGPFAASNYSLSAIIPKAALYDALVDFTWQFLVTSFTIAIIAALLIYLIVYELLVRPLRNIHDNMLDFVMEPHNPSKILVPELRNDEVGFAQRRIAALETVLQKNYVRQKHLADLGLAVSKINHDMRNVLASAQMISDYLKEVNEPSVQRLTPKLIRTINRAINYSQSIIAYGRAQEQPPQRRRLLLRRLVDDVQESLAISGKEQVDIRNFVPENFEIDADNEQLHRVITNLCRNAVEAMTSQDAGEDCAVKQISISAGRIGTTAIIDVEDTGPGLPAKAKEHLFSPFQGSARRDGIGLGLAICLELVRAHGGTIKLMEDDRPGTHFELRIPDQLSSIAQWHDKKTA